MTFFVCLLVIIVFAMSSTSEIKVSILKEDENNTNGYENFGAEEAEECSTTVRSMDQKIKVQAAETEEIDIEKPEVTVQSEENKITNESISNLQVQNEHETKSTAVAKNMQDETKELSISPKFVTRMDSTGNVKEEKTPKVKVKFEFMEFFSTFVAAFSFLCTGVFRAYASPALASLEKDTAFLNTTEIPTKELISWVASATPMAGFFGTILSGPLLQYAGRQKTIMSISFPFIIGCVLIGFATNIWMVFVGRAFTGVSTGLTTASAQLYVSECVRPQVRGSLGFLPSMFLALGVLVGFVIGATDLNWQQLSLVLTIFPVVLLVLCLMTPESPYWLLLQKREDEALKSLQKLRGKMEKSTVEIELKDLKQAITTSKHGRALDNDADNQRDSQSDHGTIKNKTKRKKPLMMAKVLSQRRIWLPTFISVCLMTLQQLCGINAIIYYLSVIIERSRSDTLNKENLMDPNTASVIVGTVQFLAFFLSLPLIDRMGRRVLLIISAVLMGLSHGSLALFFYLKDQSTLESNHLFAENTFTWFPLLCLSVFISSFSIGFGPVPFIIMSEIFPSHIRSYLCSLSSLVNHLVLFVVVLFFPFLLDGISPFWTFSLLASFCFLAVAFVAVFVPETKGKSLPEIELYFSNVNDPAQPNSPKTSTHL